MQEGKFACPAARAEETEFNVSAATVTQPRILVSTATYNERENLARLIAEIHAAVPAVDVLVVDDNSPDGTGKLADELAAAEPRVHVLHRAGKLGLGTAILAGMNYAMENGYDYFVNMDADFSHHPRYLAGLLAGMKKNDIMIGSRYVPGGGTVGWPLSRRVMSAGVNLVVRLLMRLPSRDNSGGYRVYRVALLRRTNLAKFLSRGYSFQEEVLFRCYQAGCRIGEFPIVFEDRRAGASKVNLQESVRSMGVILWLGLGAFFGPTRRQQCENRLANARGASATVRAPAASA
jgi:dolichol-phosphate mannosyltransferase